MPRSRVSSTRARAGLPRRWGLFAVLLAGPLSQLGHLLAYLVRYGSASWPEQSLGAHAYFPAVAKISAGLTGLLVLGAVAAVGLARLVHARRSPSREREVGAPVADLLAILLPLQLAVFVVQESGELLIAGQLHGLTDLPLMWGIAGQLPVALLAAVFLHWGSITVARAMRRLSLWLEPVAGPPPLAVPTGGHLALAAGLPAQADPLASRRRGPP